MSVFYPWQFIGITLQVAYKITTTIIPSDYKLGYTIPEMVCCYFQAYFTFASRNHWEWVMATIAKWFLVLLLHMCACVTGQTDYHSDSHIICN